MCACAAVALQDRAVTLWRCGASPFKLKAVHERETHGMTTAQSNTMHILKNRRAVAFTRLELR